MNAQFSGIDLSTEDIVFYNIDWNQRDHYSVMCRPSFWNAELLFIPKNVSRPHYRTMLALVPTLDNYSALNVAELKLPQ